LVEVLSGLSGEITIGSPIALMIRNADARSADYKQMETVFRPSHADFTTVAKYGVREAAGGGRSSARETIGRVAAAAVAQALCQELCPGIEALAWVDRVQDIQGVVDPLTVSAAAIESNVVRCPDQEVAALMESRILQAKAAGDSLGGSVCLVLRGVPAGLGEPVFDKFEATLAAALMSLPASKSFEIGSGVAGTYLKGSEHNDAFEMENGAVRTRTNNSGGVQGGITNGMPVLAKVGFKPVSTIFIEQETVTADHKTVRFAPKGGRHDPCVLPRAVPMVEAMAWLVLADHMLRQRALTGSCGPVRS
jgi:chorismate synthase